MSIKLYPWTLDKEFRSLSLKAPLGDLGIHPIFQKEREKKTGVT